MHYRYLLKTSDKYQKVNNYVVILQYNSKRIRLYFQKTSA